MVFGDEHDWKNYPELTNTELAEIGFTSPHVQITEDFEALVVKVHDGDTVTLRTDFRDFDFPLRFLSVDAPELSTGEPGEVSKAYLMSRVEGQHVMVRINQDNRVDKYGRLLGELVIDGLVISEEMLQFGYVLPFDQRREGEIPSLDKTLSEKQWF